MQKDELGKEGEEVALQTLLKKGYQLVERNYRIDRGEIDLIFKDKNEIVFCEVKTRSNEYLGEPWRQVGFSKQRQLIKTANAYIRKMDVYDEARFDIVSIILNEKRCKVEHIIGAFAP